MTLTSTDQEELDSIEARVKKQLPGADDLTILNALYADIKSSLLPDNVKQFFLNEIKEMNSKNV